MRIGIVEAYSYRESESSDRREHRPDPARAMMRPVRDESAQVIFTALIFAPLVHCVWFAPHEFGHYQDDNLRVSGHNNNHLRGSCSAVPTLPFLAAKRLCPTDSFVNISGLLTLSAPSLLIPAQLPQNKSQNKYNAEMGIADGWKGKQPHEIIMGDQLAWLC